MGSGNSYEDGGVTAGNQYYYKFFSYNDVYQYSNASAEGPTQTTGRAYARALLPTGNKNLIFLALPGGTTINSHASYGSYCQSAGFSENLNSNPSSDYVNAGMYSPTNFYCSDYCCYLGSGNSQAGGITSFENFGLPLGTHLRVRDRGCGNCTGGFDTGQNTSDSLMVNSTNSLTYVPDHFGANDWGVSSPDSYPEAGVIVCQEQ